MSIGQKSGVEPTRTIDEVVPAPARGMRAAREPRSSSTAERLARTLVPLVGRLDESAPDPARAAQVAILRNAVAAERYRPDLRQVAWKLLSEVAATRRA